jgi:hypothetical protein
MELICFCRSRNSSVGIASGYGLDDRTIGVRFPAGAGNFYLRHRVQTGSGAHPTFYPIGTSGSFLGLKWPGREADHSPPYSAEVKECVECYLHSPIRLHGVVFSQTLGQFTLRNTCYYQIKWWEHFEKKKDQRIPEFFFICNPEGGNNRGRPQKEGKINFQFDWNVQ